MSAQVSLLEENIDRVVSSVLRNVSAGRGAVPDPDAMMVPTDASTSEEANETLADLYGHVAYALKSLDGAAHPLATYRPPERPESPPTLNLIR
ncbi:MAG: hypothetical protein ABI194_01005 [Gemmatimonadaceae bacterium]